MQKISIKIDVSKLDKNRLVKNFYTKRDGTQVNELNAELELVEKKEARIITEGVKQDGTEWVLKETHFVAEKRGKDEEANYVGTGSQFFDKDSTTSDFDEIKAIREQHNSQINNDEGEISASDIPF